MKVLCGFTANAEISFQFNSGQSGPKGTLGPLSIDLSGGSADVAIALRHLQHDSRLVGLVGPNDEERQLLHIALKKAGITSHLIEGLLGTSLAVFPADAASPDPRVYGKRGEIDPKKRAETLSALGHLDVAADDFCVISGVSVSDSEFASLLLHKTSQGHRIVSPNRGFCDRPEFPIFLRDSADILILNASEWEACNITFQEVHELGVPFVVVTHDKRGGQYSFKGQIKAFKPVQFRAEKYFEPGAGDWFLAGLVSSMMRAGRSVTSLSSSDVEEFVRFAARVAGKKVTYAGAGKGPSLDDVLSD